MLGLTRPCSTHLSADAHARWHAHLCGTCLALRETAGQPARAVTNTDAVLLSVLVEAQQPGPAATRAAGPCALRGMRGAEVIAWPVWGCNPELARARAAENHTYLVSSTYEDVSNNWMLTAVWDHAGRTLVSAKDFGTVVMAEVDLNEHTRWRSLGDFRSKIPRHAPVVPPEKGQY